MKVCIIGDGLVSLTLANVLMLKELSVDILSTSKHIKYDRSRTLGISRDNIEYFNNNVLNIKKILWKINDIKIFDKINSKKEILNFSDSNDQIFSIVKNHLLIKLLKQKLKKKQTCKF